MTKFSSGTARTALALLLFSGIGVYAAHAEPAATSPVALIESFDHTLLGVMKDAEKLGYQGRYDILQPAIGQTFNVPLMTQLVVGSTWNDWSQSQRDEVTDA